MIKIIFSTIFPISYFEIAENCQNRNFTKINLKHVWNFKGFTPPPPPRSFRCLKYPESYRVKLVTTTYFVV